MDAGINASIAAIQTPEKAREATKDPKLFAADPQKAVATSPTPLTKYTGRLPYLIAIRFVIGVAPARHTISAPLVPEEK